MSPSEERTDPLVEYPERKLVKCCAALRCKSLFYSEDERPGLLHESDVMTYWCDYTQVSVGCDEGDVNLHLCQPGRSCHES